MGIYANVVSLLQKCFSIRQNGSEMTREDP